jgi:hypothetical protein
MLYVIAAIVIVSIIMIARFIRRLWAGNRLVSHC